MGAVALIAPIDHDGEPPSGVRSKGVVAELFGDIRPKILARRAARGSGPDLVVEDDVDAIGGRSTRRRRPKSDGGREKDEPPRTPPGNRNEGGVFDEGARAAGRPGPGHWRMLAGTRPRPQALSPRPGVRAGVSGGEAQSHRPSRVKDERPAALSPTARRRSL